MAAQIDPETLRQWLDAHEPVMVVGGGDLYRVTVVPINR